MASLRSRCGYCRATAHATAAPQSCARQIKTLAAKLVDNGKDIASQQRHCGTDGPTPISGEKVSHAPTPFLETKVMSDVSDYSHNAHRQREQGGSYRLLGGFRWIIEIEERPIVWPRLALWTTSDS
jgi:hypothetical protein